MMNGRPTTAYARRRSNGKWKTKGKETSRIVFVCVLPPAFLSGANTDPFLRGANLFWREKFLRGANKTDPFLRGAKFRANSFYAALT